DDTRLHWVANVGGKKAEWDAKILEQHPDRQISWISQDGKKTRGTVTFEPRAEGKTLVRLSMSYQAEGPAELLGSTAGLDLRRVEADLDRFKEVVEAGGAESGAWRGGGEAGQERTPVLRAARDPACRPGARLERDRLAELLAQALLELLLLGGLELLEVRARRPDTERERPPPLVERRMLDGNGQRRL